MFTLEHQLSLQIKYHSTISRISPNPIWKNKKIIENAIETITLIEITESMKESINFQNDAHPIVRSDVYENSAKAI